MTRYHETLEQIVYADELGFDTAWLAELHFNRPFSIMPAPLIVAAALAQRTTRIRLGTAVALLPLQHPLRTAEDAATVDILSQGRLEFGVGRGTIALHFQGFNVSRDESRERFEEALTILEQAWTQETCRFDGKYFQVPDTAVVPKPLQKPHPPLRIAANSPETAGFSGERGYPVFVASPINPLLGALANNGGPTQTMALLSGSRAINAGNDSVCTANPVNDLDQRGLTRTANGPHCDIGAYELIGVSGIALLPGGTTRLAFLTPTNQIYSVLATTNLSSWETIGLLPPPGSNGAYDFYDTNSVGFSRRFYRILVP